MYVDRISDGHQNEDPKYLPLGESLKLLINRWRFIAMLSFACALTAAIISLLIPNKYTAVTTSLPAGGDNKSGGIMSFVENTPGLEMLGLNSDKNAPSLLYPEILKSRMIADEILINKYSYNEHGEMVETDLFGYFDIENPDLAYKKLQKITGISFDKKTGIVELSVTAKNPELSAQIANYYMVRLDEFNKHKRKSSAMLKRQFIEKRLTENKEELAAAEELLKDFRENNRHYLTTTDPLIIMEHNRLLRDVEVKAQVYQMLSEEYEMAAIQEKKETPVIQTLDVARPPSVKSAPARTKITILALLSGLILSSLIVYYDHLYLSDKQYNSLKKFTGRIRLIVRHSKEESVELERRH